MKLSKIAQRDSKVGRRRKIHITDGRSTFLIQEAQRVRAERIKQARDAKENLLDK